MRKIAFADGRYRVSMLGHVRNYWTNRYLKPNNIGGGYLQVTLYYNGLRKSFLIHRLVAEAYIPNPNGYTQINHKDGNPSNNNRRNLEWITGSKNVLHSYENGRKRSNHSTKKKLDGIQGETIQSLIGYVSIKQLARYFKVNRTTIRRAV